MNKEKINVITLGCSKNNVDSERLMNQIRLNNCKLVDEPGDAETVIINTCGFIEAAKKESIETILKAVALKKQGIINKVIVAGCLSERYMSELEKEIPEVDRFFGTEDYEGIISELGGELKYNLLGERVLTSPAHSAYLKISEGCDHPCSFCAIPIMRGKHQSKTIEELVTETEFLAKQGTKELVIIAQDTTDYGTDIYGKREISKLLRRLSEIEGIEWIRIMYTYPTNFPDDLIEEIATNPKICKYVDIPLQHISDSVLKSMRRGVTSKRIRELITKLRKRIPEIAIRTTFITGYPNETEEDFEELFSFIKEVRFDRLGVFTFSVEENTTSFILGDPIPEKVKERRKSKIMELQSIISGEINREYTGKTMKVLIDRIEGEFYIARSYRDAPEVDGEILIPIGNSTIKAGNFCDVKVYDTDEYDLYAEID